MKRFIITAVYVISVIIVFSVFFSCGNATLENEDDENSTVTVFTVYTQEDGIADNWITDIAVDYIRKGVWCTTLNGISFYSTVDSTWTTFGAEYDIPKMKVTSITIDYSGTVWAGTESGPTSLSDTLWTALSDMDSLIHRHITVVTSISDGSLWFGTKGGVSRYSFLGWSSYTTASGLTGDDVTSITSSSDGNIWIGTTNGISVFDGENWKQYGSEVLSSTVVNVVYAGYDGTMWCGTASGISALRDNSWIRYGAVDGIPAPGINDFVEDRTYRLWVATDGGYSDFSNDKGHKLVLPSEVADVVVTALAVDITSGALWIGTQNGVVIYQVE